MPFNLPSKLPIGSKIPGVGSAGNKPKEASLNDILPTNALRVDLVLLVALCTDAMRDHLNDVLGEKRSKQAYSAALNRDDVFGTRGAEAVLLAGSVRYLNDWRTNILRAMGEALNVRPEQLKRRKAAYMAQPMANKSSHSLLDGAGRDSWLPFTAVQPSDALMHELDTAKRALALGALLFILLSLGDYPAHSRVLLLFLCESLELPIDVLSSAEATTAVTLLKSAAGSASVDGSPQADEARLAQADKGRQGRRWKVGLATVAGAVAIGVTGGLAAPLLLGAAGAIMGGIGLGGLATLLGATIANPLTIAALFGALGGRMTGRSMEEYAREVEDFRFLPVKQTAPGEQDEQHKLRVAIGVSGWVGQESDVIQPWKVLSPAALEAFGLRYELSAMINLAGTLDTALRDSAYSIAQAGAMKLLLPVLSAALLPVSLLKAGKFLDNPFTVAMERSDKAGRVLAHALIARVQGKRPVTFIAYSLGARVVYSCLQELAAQNAFGLVEHAVLIGAPVPSDAASWRKLRTMVVGRLVNVYATKDFLLGFLYRARNAQLGVAGLQAITGVPGVENKDVSDIVLGHNQYRLAMGTILRRIHFTDLDLTRVREGEQELEAEKMKEKKVHDEAKRNGLLKADEDENGQIKMMDPHAQEAPRQELDGREIGRSTKFSSTMSDLQGLDLGPGSSKEVAGLQHGSSKPPEVAQSIKPQRQEQNVPAPAPAQSPSRHRLHPDDDRESELQEQLTPTTSDDEDDSRPIRMMDLEPEPVPDTPPRWPNRH